MRKDITQQDMPIQPVENPILCSPYREPDKYWEYDRQTGAARLMTGDRRPSAYWYKYDDRDTRRGNLTLELQEDRRDLTHVNHLRADVKRWRGTDYEGATNVTKDLLRHWRRPDRLRPFFFCQLEAVETIIFLSEMRGLNADGSRRRPRWNPAFEDNDFPLLWQNPVGDGREPLPRYCTKMATGSGKTVVMGMLITWAFCNHARVPSDPRFPGAALVVCPNLTIKERLQVLRTDASVTDYYTQFEMVPPQYRDLLRSGKVLVTNWHLFAPESEHSEGGRSYTVVNKGAESDNAFAHRVLGELYDSGPIMVLNDEAHHAYRPAPVTTELKGEEAQQAKDMNEEATVWVTGLDRIAAADGYAGGSSGTGGIRLCVDLSATPFFIKGSGYPEGEPFPWIVSDFGLVDAIESGITKIPRLPVLDTTGRPDPAYFQLWRDHIIKDLQPAERMAGSRKPRPDVVWLKAQDALTTLAGQYKSLFEQVQQSSNLAHKAPPVMIIVCDNTDIAEVFFRNISGEREEEALDADDVDADEGEEDSGGRKKKAKKRTVYADGKPFPELFQNGPGERRTLRIDTKLLEKIESEDPGASREKAALELREIVNTVGKPGQPGEQIRCVVSVQMLSEGWDANNVTHILGLRAFGSQLLCEQVVGRGLRRMNYTPDPETGLLPEEYVDVYGIPFSVIPYKGRPVKTSPGDDHIVNHVKALPERAGFEIRFPCVEGYVFALRKNMITIDLNATERLIVEPNQLPTGTFVRPASGYREGTVSGHGSGQLVLQDREAYYNLMHPQQIEYETARLIVDKLVGDGIQAHSTAKPALRLQSRHQLFPQVLRIVHQYVQRKVQFNGAHPCELGLDIYVTRIVERLLAAIEPAEEHGEPPLLPLLNQYKPIGTTADVNFLTRRQVCATGRSHINAVVQDTITWESSAAFYLEQATDSVLFYARNDKLGLVIPYEYQGINHSYEPDFLVRLIDGRTALLEIKGYEDDQTQAKHQAAQRWVTAVNNWGKLGQWIFPRPCHNPHLLPRQLAYLVREGVVTVKHLQTSSR